MSARRSACSAGTRVLFEPYSTTTRGPFPYDEDASAPTKGRPSRLSKTDVSSAPRGPRGFRRYRNGLLNATPLGPEIAMSVRTMPVRLSPSDIRQRQKKCSRVPIPSSPCRDTGKYMEACVYKT